MRFFFSQIKWFVIFALSIFLVEATESDRENTIPPSKPIMNLKSKFDSTIWGITEEQLDQLFENSSDYVALVSENYLTRVNHKWTEILGWTAEELMSKPYVDFIHHEDTVSTKEIINTITYNKCTINFENSYHKKTGGYHQIQWLGLQQVSGANRNSPVLAIGRDLTLEREAKEQMYALQQAEATNRLKSSFVTHMSHEIRTPLNGVLGFLDLALEEEISGTVRSFLKNAKESSHFLLNVANDIIDTSKIESNTLKINKADFNPLETIHSALSLLTLQAKKKNLLLKSSIGSGLPLTLQGDENRLKQILFNLIGNAIKFTDHGKVSLKIDGERQSKTPSTFLLKGQVKDTGIGIDAEHISQLFQPFSQVDHSMNRQFGGSGLGLYITKQLCKKMQGDVQVISAIGLGTTFQFHIFFDYLDAKPPTAKLKSTQTLIPEKELSYIKNVLVVEDNVMNQKVMRQFLSKLGYKVDIVENGQEGVTAVNQKIYDLVLMDGEMPVMHGLDATREIRKSFSMDKLPIVGVSAFNESSYREKFLSVGANGYIAKPINMKSFTEEIVKCFQNLSHNTALKTKE